MDLVVIGIVTSVKALSVAGISLEGAPTPPALGQFVEVRAQSDSGAPRAHSVARMDAVVGPVTAKYEGGQQFDFLGERVRLIKETVFGPGVTRDRLAHAGAEERFRVNGLRAPDGSIIATRIDEAPASEPSQVAGTPADMPDGARFIVEGYVSGAPSEGRFGLGGVTFAMDADLGTHVPTDRLVRAIGHVDATGKRVVERVEFLSSPLDPKAAGGVGAASASSPERPPRPPSAGFDRPKRPADRPQRGELGED